MKLQILGCGTSTGVPMPGCQCSVCLSQDARNKRSRTSALIRAEGNFNILIDTTTDLRYQAIAADLRNVNSVLYTHAHADHILGLDDLRGFNYVQNSIIPCYGTEHTISEIKRCFAYIFNPAENYEGGLVPQVAMHVIQDYSVFSVGPVTVQAFSLQHGRTKVTGYRIGDFAYATDCNFIPEESKEILRGIRLLVLDGLRFEPHKTHFTIPQAVETAQELGAEMTYLTHMTHTIDYATVSRELPDNVRLAYDGLTIDI